MEVTSSHSSMRRTPDRRARSCSLICCQSWQRALSPPIPVTTTRCGMSDFSWSRAMPECGRSARRPLLLGEQAGNHALDVADGTHLPEIVRADLAAGQLLHLDDHVHGVDAVKVEIFVEAGLGRDGRRVELEFVDQSVLEGLENVLWSHRFGHGYAKGPEA